MKTKRIEELVEHNPGISFTELKNKLNLANGTLQYHIRKSDKIKKRKGGLIKNGFCRKCCFKDICDSKCLYKILRNPLKKKIARKKLEGYSNTEIAELEDIDESTVTYHIQNLESLELL